MGQGIIILGLQKAEAGCRLFIGFIINEIKYKTH